MTPTIRVRNVTRFVAKSFGVGASAALALYHQAVLAVLPTPTQTTGAASGDYLAVFRDYWKQGVLLLALVLASFALLVVGGGAVSKFNEYRVGRAELGDLLTYVILGVIVLLIVIYLANEASKVL